MAIIKYSASDLIKKSCRQIVFLRNKRQQIATSMQNKGIKFQSKITDDIKQLNSGRAAEELRGQYLAGDILIFFCVDIFADNKFYEVKSIQDKDGNITTEYPQWYLESSLLQCALYKSLLIEGNNDVLFTPKFRIKEGFEYVAQPVDKFGDYFLIFGDVAKYQITVNDSTSIIDFYLDKIEHCANYDLATKFDNNYKRKEFELLSQFFDYKIVK